MSGQQASRANLMGGAGLLLVSIMAGSRTWSRTSIACMHLDYNTVVYGMSEKGLNIMPSLFFFLIRGVANQGREGSMR